MSRAARRQSTAVGVNVGSSRGFQRMLTDFEQLCLIEGHNLTGKSLAELKKRQLETKNKIDFTGCNLTAEQVANLCTAAIKHMAVAKIELNNNNLTEDTARHVEEMLAEQVNYALTHPLATRLHDVFVGFISIEQKPPIPEYLADSIKFLMEILAYANAECFLYNKYVEQGVHDGHITHTMFMGVYMAVSKALWNGKTKPTNAKADEMIEQALGRPGACEGHDDLTRVLLHRLYCKKLLPCDLERQKENVIKFQLAPRYQAILTPTPVTSPTSGAGESGDHGRETTVDSPSASPRAGAAGGMASPSPMLHRTASSKLFGIVEDGGSGEEEDSEEGGASVAHTTPASQTAGGGSVERQGSARTLKERLAHQGVVAVGQHSESALKVLTNSPEALSPPTGSPSRSSTKASTGTKSPKMVGVDNGWSTRLYESSPSNRTISKDMTLHGYVINDAKTDVLPLGGKATPKRLPPESSSRSKSPRKEAQPDSPQRKFASVDLTGTVEELMLPPSLSERNFTFIRRLVLTQGDIEEVNLSSLAPLENLLDLSLMQNKIQRISGVMPPRVARLNLSYNNLSDLNHLATSGCQRLRDLFASHNRIASVGLLPNTALERLDLSDNMINDPLTLRMLGFCDKLASVNIANNPVEKSISGWKLKLKSYLPRLVEINGDLKHRPRMSQPYTPLDENFALKGTNVYRLTKAEQKEVMEQKMHWRDAHMEKWMEQKRTLQDLENKQIAPSVVMDAKSIEAITKRLSGQRIHHMKGEAKSLDLADSDADVSSSAGSAVWITRAHRTTSEDSATPLDWSTKCRRIIAAASSAATLIYVAVIRRGKLNKETVSKFEAKAKALNLSDEAFLEKASSVEELTLKENVAALNQVLRDSLWVLSSERTNPEMAKSAIHQIFETDAGLEVASIINKSKNVPSKLSSEEVTANMEKVKRRLSTSLDLNFIYNDDLLASFGDSKDTREHGSSGRAGTDPQTESRPSAVGCWDGVVRDFIQAGDASSSAPVDEGHTPPGDESIAGSMAMVSVASDRSGGSGTGLTSVMQGTSASDAVQSLAPFQSNTPTQSADTAEDVEDSQVDSGGDTDTGASSGILRNINIGFDSLRTLPTPPPIQDLSVPPTEATSIPALMPTATPDAMHESSDGEEKAASGHDVLPEGMTTAAVTTSGSSTSDIKARLQAKIAARRAAEEKNE